MRAYLFAVFSLATACYSPNLSGVQYTCDENNPICPGDYVCLGNTCVAPGTEPPPVTDTPTDSPDGGSSMMMPPGSTTAKGCRNNVGYVLGLMGAERYACPGAFNWQANFQRLPVASRLCADGYTVCKTADKIDLPKCEMQVGFYAANTAGRRDKNDYDLSGWACADPTDWNNHRRTWNGCGGRKNSVYAKSCMMFKQTLDCSNAADWSCSWNTSLDDTSNTNANDGVLCCK